jgi:hypothetical protein
VFEARVINLCDRDIAILILKILIIAAKKREKKINILEFGRELGKENWSLGICVALYFYFFFQVLLLLDLIFILDSKFL